MSARSVHWIGDAPTSLHGNGPAHFRAEGHGVTRDVSEVTCRLCLTLLDRTGGPAREESQGRPVTPRCDSCGRFMSEPAEVVPVRDSVHPYTADFINLCRRCADARA